MCERLKCGTSNAEVLRQSAHDRRCASCCIAGAGASACIAEVRARKRRSEADGGGCVVKDAALNAAGHAWRGDGEAQGSEQAT